MHTRKHHHHFKLVFTGIITTVIPGPCTQYIHRTFPSPADRDMKPIPMTRCIRVTAPTWPRNRTRHDSRLRNKKNAQRQVSPELTKATRQRARGEDDRSGWGPGGADGLDPSRSLTESRHHDLGRPRRGRAAIYPGVRPRSSPPSNLTPSIWVVALLGVGGGVGGSVRACERRRVRAGRAWRRAISCSRVGRRGSSDLTSGEASNLSRQGWFW